MYSMKSISPARLVGMAVLFYLAVSPSFALFDRGGILGVGTRAMGLSGAFVAVADDASAAYWNPAGLVQLDQAELLGMYGSYLNDKNRNLYFSFQYPLPDDIHLAVSLNDLFYTDIPGAEEDQYAGSVAIPVDFVTGKRLLLGANFKYLFSNTGSGGVGDIEGAGVDLGLLYRQPFKDNTEFKAGLALTDLSTTVRYDSTGEEQSIPSVLTLGFAYLFDPYTLISSDIPWTLSNDALFGGEDVRLRGGVEHWFFDGRLGLRAGFISFITLPGEFSVGASYRVTDWSVDYAYSNHPDLGNNHRLSASYYFSAGGGKPEPKPYMVQSLVGDGEIYLKWDIPEGSQAEGFLVYIRSGDEKDFQRAKQELLQTKFCLLKGAKNGVPYHIIIRSVVGGQEKYSCNEWTVTARPMLEDAQKYYDQGVRDFQKDQIAEALYEAHKAEEFDPNNYDIKNLIQKLETTHHEGLVPEGENSQ